MAIVDCFLAWHSGMGGGGFLPYSGGYAEQPSALMSTFRYMSAQMAKLERK